MVSMINEYARQYTNYIISNVIHHLTENKALSHVSLYNKVVKKFAIDFVDDLLCTNFFSPRYIEYFYYQKHINTNFIKDLDEICMLCNYDINNEIIIYKCLQCNCYMHHSCINGYFSKYVVNECIQCKIDYSSQLIIGIINFHWVDNKIESYSFEFTSSDYLSYKSSIVKIYYRNQYTKKIIKDLQICVTRANNNGDIGEFIMLYLQSNNTTYEINNTYTVYIYKYTNIKKDEKILINTITDFTDDCVIELL